MKRVFVWLNQIIKKHKEIKRWKRIVTVLAAMITFVTTYALILPAITVERNNTEEVGGMYLKQEEDRNELLEENALEFTGVSIAADQENAVTYEYADEDMTAVATFSTDEEIPEGAELVVNTLDPESEEYETLCSRAADLLDKEFIYDITTCAFYDFALICDDVDVTPETGLVDVQINYMNNTVRHVDDAVFAGRFGIKVEETDGFVALATDDQTQVNDELVSTNADESPVIELTDSIITTLSLKGNDLSQTDSVVGILAGNVDEETRAAAAEKDAEIPDYNDFQEKSAPADSAETDGEEAAPEVGTLKAAGSDYTVTLTYDATSEIPDGASLTVSEIEQDSKEYKTYLEETKKAMGLTEEETLPRFAARFFDIKIMVGDEEFTPKTGVSVEITYAEPLAENPETEVSAVHFADEAAKAEVIDANASEVKDDGAATVEFMAESFSVYGVIYTVDFHWEVNGKMYEFSLPGGGFVSLQNLIEVLSISHTTYGSDSEAENPLNTDGNGVALTENNEDEGDDPVDEVPGANNQDASLLALDDVTISDATRSFVANVESVVFSSPELVDVSKVENETTVGGIKESRALEVQYSAELTEEQIEEINAQTVEAGDWALISILPFDSEETLTVTMKTGEVYEIHVTDYQLRKTVITASGDTYVITATYGRDAQIPDGAELNVREILPEDEDYSNVQRMVDAGLDEGKDKIPVSPVLFDISIVHNGQEIEPAEGSEVFVEVKFSGNSIKGMYTDEDSPVLINDMPVMDENSEMNKQFQILHLTKDDQVELMDTTDTITAEELASSFTTDSFSNWLVYLDEDLTDIYLKVGDSLTLRPYSEWYWKANDDPYVQDGAQWIFPNNEYTTQNGSVTVPTNYSGSTTTLYGITRASTQNGKYVFSGSGKYDRELHETYWFYHITNLQEGDFDIHTNKDKTIHIHVRPGTATKPNTVQGVPGLTVNLFDYDVPTGSNGQLDFTKSGSLDCEPNQANATNSQYYNASVNQGHDLKFLGYGAGNNDSTVINNYTNENAHQGVVKQTLGSDGYPVVNNSNSQSLKYLFDTTSKNSNVYAFSDVDGLFRQDNLGYYYYNSNVNYAEYNQTTNKFVLYEHTYTQNTGGSNGANAKPIGFFPFHEYDTVETQPEMNFNTNLNHHFGMSMELSFEIPKDRKAPDPTGYKHDIIYEFSGDDDLWVFVDDELVLDIGGIHQPVTGTINFTTGVISVHGVTTDKTMTFDVGVHTLKMFYMERGGCDSNLSVRFNLPLTIGKGNMRFVKKGTSSDTGLMGAVFGIWDNPTCQGEPYTVAASDRNGIVFKGLPIREEGQKYYLQEMVPPSGYKLDKTIYTLTATTKDENGDYQFRISVGDTTVSDSDSVYALPIIRNDEESPIQIKVHKEWEDAAEDPINPAQNVTAKFRINRKRTYSVDPLLTVNLIPEEPEHYNSAIFDSIPAFAGDVLTIEYKHDTAHQGASNGYIRTAGGNQNVLPLLVNSTGDPVSVTYTVNASHADSNGEINIYIPEAFTQYCNGTEYAGGVNPHFENLQTAAHHTITEADTDYNNSNDSSRIVELSAAGNWEGSWNNLPVTGRGTEPGQIYHYEYYIEEIDVPEWFEVIYLDSDGKPIAGDHSEETSVNEDTINVINREFVDVPIEKRWPDFSGDNYSWEATFVLEMREIKVLPADPNAEIPPSAPDAVTEWTEVGTDRNPILNTGSTQTPWTLTVQKGVTPPEFTDLPIYRVHSNGTKYKIEYSVSEIAYEVKRGSDVVAKWTRENGLNYIGDARYTPQFIQDAGENGSSIEDYEIIIANVLAGTKVEREIDINIEKAWPDGSDYASNPDTYAKFVLKRYVHEEYRDYSGPNVPTEWVEVTLDTFGDGTGLQTLSVPKGTTIHIVGSIKGNTNANSIKFQQISKTNALINEITHDQNNTNEDPAKFDITFSPQEDQTVKLTQGDNYVVGGRDGFRISDTYGSATVDSKDNTYSKEFTLNQGNNWKEISDHLPLIVESDMDPTDGSQTIYVYSYYLEEVACSPEDFHPEFQVGNTSIKIDQDHRIETTMSLKANNEPNTVDFKIKKVDKKDVNNPDAPTLHGAEFKIVKYSSLSPSHTKDTSWGTNGEKPMTEISETPGIFEIADLTTGYYEIVETKYPDGYITDIPNPFFQVRQTNTIGELETVLVDSTGVPIDGNATDTIIMEDLLLTYGNTPGAALPNTGGPGTRLFTLLGSILILGAGILLWRRRRTI